mmetsp:Transcript_25539/g.52247  ORF Transcript_25539/g.52247 Transcript_25539/m.52247 type:complete len:237 (-) Transcript_25539:616-1326(-)|eukprot:CAMPEP_0183305074 /NCGR_PEP_ID=MMETSP0160_2-20130417/9936_1 /TAXON_ID=2839 ORGANISM="Odontella Sinensis, Strain Grunow 1884" /NCGR_SAMPLE_ID=MMETSP0160_2 /ASSEMBLY_ACC=CAM_ASM_000250 /LENGTH=236 /DNA_ID=CAMNT_0025468223 /DNA_START=460 /DNA_END=1170 /DNA_ORIENTATION=-
MILKPIFMLFSVTGAVSTAFCPHPSAFNGRKSAAISHHSNHNGPPNTAVSSTSGNENLGAYSYFGGDDIIMKELKERIAGLNNPYREVFGYVWARPKPERVHIILFNPGTNQEGVHTVEFPKGSGNNVILAFESKDECEKFSENLPASLRVQKEDKPQEMKLEFLEAYCEPLGVHVQVVPKGMDIRPPTENVKSLGHDANLMDQKHVLDYLFDLLDENEIEEDGAVQFDELVGTWQ